MENLLIIKVQRQQLRSYITSKNYIFQSQVFSFTSPDLLCFIEKELYMQLLVYRLHVKIQLSQDNATVPNSSLAANTANQISRNNIWPRARLLCASKIYICLPLRMRNLYQNYGNGAIDFVRNDIARNRWAKFGSVRH